MIKSTRNQLGNCKNGYQTDEKRVLCICSAGLLRSPTAANVLHKKFGWNTRAAGSCPDFALIPVTEVLLTWADLVIFVNPDNLDDLDEEEKSLLAKREYITLNIPDSHNWGEPELEGMIFGQVCEKLNIS